MIAALANHVWQSTLFAVVVALITVAFRRNRAPVRFWLWFSASFKFFVPFSLLMGLGSHLGWAPVTNRVAAPAVSFTMEQASQPFLNTWPSASSTTRTTVELMPLIILGLWLSGFAAVALMRFRGWYRIRAAVRSSTSIDIPTTVEVRSSPGLLEPGVVGLFRPVLLLPAGIVERLAPRQFEAVLAHELCHVRRRDNLTAAIHMIVEAVFWFHPLVWWIGARLVEERERACDEAVLCLGNEPHDYAEGILNVCKSYLESPLSCASGVTGSNLDKRIQTILTGRLALDLNLAKKLVLTAAAVATLMIPVAVGIISAPAGRAQSRRATPKFEAASIKSCDTFRRSPAPIWASGTLLQTQCTTVQRLIQQAYGLFAEGRLNLGSSLTVTGGPTWTKSNFYEVEAKAAQPEHRAVMNGPMLQAVLEDRFKLKAHRETREVPVYALTVAQGGPKLHPFGGSCTPLAFDKTPSDSDCATARGYGNEFHLKAATMADLCAGFLVMLDRPVIDQTGITGRFNLSLELSGENRKVLDRPRSLPALSDPTLAPPPPVSFAAMKEAVRKLGLNLEPTKGPREFLVIDSVERPSHN
jgi:bla regulator protein BlaR1